MKFKYEVGDVVRIISEPPINNETDHCLWVMNEHLGAEAVITEKFLPPNISTYRQPRYKINLCNWTFVEDWLYLVDGLPVDLTVNVGELL